MRAVGVLFFFCGLLIAGFASPLRAQGGPETDGNEVEFWTTGGHGTNGIAQHTGVWTAGFRYGWVITAPHGPSLLRGRFEYAVDAVPVFVLFQPSNTAYGVALDPFALIWDSIRAAALCLTWSLAEGLCLRTLKFLRELPASTSQPPAGSACIFWRAN